MQPIGDDQLGISYHWETPDDKHTYLHLTPRKSPDEPFAIAHANMDSEDIRGQGDALWSFLSTQLQDVSNRGNFTVYHDVDTNNYSRRLPEADPRYEEVGENKYRGAYNPVPQEAAINTYLSERV